LKHNAELTLPVSLTYDILEPMQVGDLMLPAQIDIKEVFLEVVGPSGKPRRIDITNGIPEEQMLLWEDEIIESL
jgi:hypothetical protein